ncbi:MAG TPA: hypothetical protein VK348_00325, partial [Planctomycetota bacterium]|nr:hypothetical protein [Planctomycetota bacterium]
MTIYGVGYRPLQVALLSPVRRLWPLVVLEFKSLFRTRWGVVGFLLCLMPQIVSLMVLLARMNVLNFIGHGGPRPPRGMRMPDEALRLDPTAVQFYVEPIMAPNQGLTTMLILTAMVTSRAIAKDRGANALELYWTRGISPLGYFFAKWLGSFLLVGLVTVAMPLLLWLIGVFLAEDWSFFQDTVKFMPRALLGLATFSAVMCYCAITLSAFANSANIASILWCLLLIGSLAVGNMLAGILHQPEFVARLSLW